MKSITDRKLSYDPMSAVEKIARDYIIYQSVIADGIDPIRVAIIYCLTERRVQQIVDALVRMSLERPKKFEMWYEIAKNVNEIYGQYGEEVLKEAK